ncbi:hypothetical protein [Pseudomonas bohemica]|uniref:hypothetical protein n=1 Tax=Pseudomonas bohemica TaxID=2044872 RepID=UPI000DA623C7|nr:hypothetical protein [Pseudomonas bohemica]
MRDAYTEALSNLVQCQIEIAAAINELAEVSEQLGRSDMAAEARINMQSLIQRSTALAHILSGEYPSTDLDG